MQYIFVLFSLYFHNTIANDDPIVTTNVGTIRGVRASDGDYSMFMGIPYGKVNSSNPFGLASPYPNFEGIYDANDDTVACPQIEEYNGTIIGTPDCLDLNIYVPDSASVQEPAAILVWIYGGLFSIGFASRYVHGPKFFVRHDVILITINYRLGPYGFMCLHTPEVPGNQGLRDQLLALEWIKNNIAHFGGDPIRVTLFGNSAGSMSADLFVWSGQENLFNGIILESGNAFSVSWRAETDTDDVLELAEAFDLSTTNINDALEFLAMIDSHTLIEKANELQLSFNPCIEERIDGINRIILDNVVNLELPKVEGLNVMVGYNDDEMKVGFAFTAAEMYPTLYQNYFRSRLQPLFDFDDDTLDKTEKMVRDFYIGEADLSIAIRKDLSDFASDTSFVYSTERTLTRYLEKDFAVYYYVFSYNGERNLHKKRVGGEVGSAWHGDEVGYLFDVSFYPEPNPEDQLIVDRMTLLWANFAKYGDPTPETSELLPVKWEPITKASVYHYLNISTDISAGRRPFNQRMTFWDLFYKTYGQYERTFKTSGAPKLTTYSIVIVAFLMLFELLY